MKRNQQSSIVREKAAQRDEGVRRNNNEMKYLNLIISTTTLFSRDLSTNSCIRDNQLI